MMSTKSRELAAEISRPALPTDAAAPAALPAQVQHDKTRVLWLAIAAAALLWSCYYPANCGWLAWVALVPILGLVRSTAPPAPVYLAACICGLLCYGPALQWLRLADERMYFTWAGLALYCSLFTPAAVYLLRRFDRCTGLPLVLALPVIWTALEYFRAHFGTGFPWYFLAHTQHDFLPVIQIADLAGAYAVTFLVAAVNALFFEWFYASHWFRTLFQLREPAFPMTSSQRTSQFIAVLILLSAVLGYGFWRLSQSNFADGPRVALIQGNLPQRIRNDASAEPEAAAANMVREHYKELCNKASDQKPRPDLIVWPETSFPEPWIDVAPDLPRDRVPGPWHQESSSCRQLARVLIGHWKTNVLLGTNRALLGADGLPRSYNSAVLIDRHGQKSNHYDKIHRVPFGEYVPLRDWLPWMEAFAPYDFDYSINPGESCTRFSLDGYHFGVVICYEDTDPYLARQYVRPVGNEPAVDFILNISNDGWFDGSSEHEQHLAICRFRAVECRRAIARAVNMGISAVIDGNGRVVALPGAFWSGSKKIAAVLTATIPVDQRTSLYARWGDWLPWTCWLVVGGGLVWSLVWSRRPSSTMLG